MIAIPWLVFAAAGALIVWKRTKAKAQYLRRVEQEKSQNPWNPNVVVDLGSYINAERITREVSPVSLGPSKLGHIPEQKPYQA